SRIAGSGFAFRIRFTGSRPARSGQVPLTAGGGSTMADDTIDLATNYLLLEPDGEAVLLPGGGDFWRQLMSGDVTDSGIRRLMGSQKGRLLSALSMGADWT